MKGFSYQGSNFELPSTSSPSPHALVRSYRPLSSQQSQCKDAPIGQWPGL